MVKERYVFLDKLRVSATCAVVLLHTITGVADRTDMSAYPAERTAFLVLMDLITWCVPVFVMISGWLFLNPERTFSFPAMITKYCRRIVLALFLFGMPYACMELVMEERGFYAGMAVKAFRMVCTGQTWSHMWYLYLTLVLYLMTPALKWLLGKLPKEVVYAVLAILLLESSVLPFLKKLFGWENLITLPDGGIYLFYYLCGYLFVCRENASRKKRECIGMPAGILSEDDRSVEDKTAEDRTTEDRTAEDKTAEGKMTGKVKGEEGTVRRRVLIACAAVLIGGMACSRMFGNYNIQMAYNYPFTVVLSLLLVGIAKDGEKGCGQERRKCWHAAGELCFAVYLIHPVFLNLLYKLFDFSPLDFPVLISLPAVFVSVLFLSAVGAWGLRQIPLLKRFVL